MFFKKKEGKKKIETQQNILDIPVVKEYKYLGIWIDDHLNFKK